MHRLAATPGGWEPNTEGVIFIEQTPAPIIFLSAADTDIQTLAATLTNLPPQFPAIRAVNLLQLQQQLSIDTYAESVLSAARIIILRLIGGRSYWSYGLEVLKETVRETQASLWVLPGDDRLEASLFGHSTVPLETVELLWQYLSAGGGENWSNGLKLVVNHSLNNQYQLSPPQSVPSRGIYPSLRCLDRPKVGIIFYRAHYLAGNTQPIDALCQALINKNLDPVPVFVASLKDGEIQEFILSEFKDTVELILNTTSFSIIQLSLDTSQPPLDSLWQQLDVPVFQVILSSTTSEQWQDSYQGLFPRDVAINVALPEVDGRIITRAISFKSFQNWHPGLETSLVVYQAQQDRVNFVVDLAANWVKLKNTPPEDKKIAMILANYPNRDGRLANGVGLDTPASCVEILKALAGKGYDVQGIPQDADELIKILTSGITNDLEGISHRLVYQTLPLATYLTYFKTLPESVQSALNNRWGEPNGDFAIPGRQLGNIFIGIQPSRGYDLDPSLSYHAGDLEPTHQYLAYYFWLREIWQATAVIHVGKHGNLEWLPGKSLALSTTCYPEIALGALPHFYPFIVNDPGEGSQAKRRAQAVILDHLTPPMTRAELYGDLAHLERLIDEYYQAQSLDPSRLKAIQTSITQLLKTSHLEVDLGITSQTLGQWLTQADGYLCELKEAQIRDGLHIFGCCPEGEQLRDLIVAIARHPSLGRLGLIPSLAKDLGQEAEGKAIAVLESKANYLVETLLQNQTLPPLGPHTQGEIDWIEKTLIPSLRQTNQEVTHLLQGLAGQYIPSGGSGAPTRGRPDVLPTGRNFYSVDVRGIPTQTAWDVGRKAAETLIERYTQDNGEYPKTLAISIWGTSTMRTGGDDVSQVLALLGVQPIWEGISGRVIGYEILTPSALGRPRVDVTIRVSGFFRDSFPSILFLLNCAINEVACQEEDAEINPLAAQVQTDKEFWQLQGLTEAEAKERATYRVFGSKPGAYGAGLQGLMESQNWETDEDIAKAYINSSCYAYDGQGMGHTLPEVFSQRVQQLQIVLQNQDNREHDLLDSDDYYQFQGGLIASVRALTGKNPQAYFGDNANPNNPQVRTLSAEILRVYRSRVINPKWIKGVMRHGYKGAFEMAATVDYLFAYDATARCVEDFVYEGVAQAYLFDDQVREFIQAKNPWALRDMGERLLEAHQRGLWEQASEQTLDQLRAIIHEAEGVIEEG